METYPIMIDEALAGKLTVDKQGARTVFDAECRALPGLVRLSVYGGGKEGYLGVLAPGADGKLRLHKALSRDAMRGFPEEIERAERAGLDRSPAPAPEQSGGSPHEASPEQQEQDVGTAHGAAPDASETESPEAGGNAEARTPGAPEVPSGAGDTEGLDWYSSPDGALVCFDGERNLFALPAGDPRNPEGAAGEKRIIEGKEYLVYRTKGGRIVP